MLLKADGISLAYANVTVLNEVGFTLDREQRVLLLGPSGSGKSTLLNILCGIQTPDAGEVQINDEIMVSATTSAQSDRLRKQNFGIIFQTLRLVSALTVRANLLLAQRLQCGRTNPETVDATLERLGIANKANARPFELSQGEAQRAAIARALVVEPKIVVADEPTSALDATNTQIVAELLIEVAKEAGASLLVATHDDRLMPYFDRTLVLEEGRIKA